MAFVADCLIQVQTCAEVEATCKWQYQTSTLKGLNCCLTCCLSSFSVNASTLHDCKYSLRDALRCQHIVNTTLLDCLMVHLMQYFYDPGILPSS